MKLWLAASRSALSVLMMLFILTVISISCSQDKKTGASPVELSLWHGLESQESTKILKEKISEFEKIHPDIRIEAQNYGAADQLKAKVMTAIAGNNPPDLLWWGPHATGLLARSGALLDLTPFLEADKEFNRADIYSRLWDLCRYQNRIYAVPFDANNLGLYYNKTHFKSAGIDPAKLKTWADLKKIAAKLTIDDNSDGTIDRYGFQIPLGHSEWTVWIWQTFLWQAGGRFLNPSGTLSAFNSPSGIDALQFWVDMIHTYKAANFSESDAGYKTDDFIAGRISMMINGPWNMKLLNEAKEKNQLDFGVLPLPSRKAAATNIGGENMFVFRTDSSKDEAKWAFAKFILSPAFQTEWAIETGYLPINKRVLTDKKYIAFLTENEFIKVYNDQMAVGRTRPTIPAYPAVSDALGRQIEMALFRKVSVAQALTDAESQANKLLASEKP